MVLPILISVAVAPGVFAGAVWACPGAQASPAAKTPAIAAAASRNFITPSPFVFLVARTTGVPADDSSLSVGSLWRRLRCCNFTVAGLLIVAIVVVGAPRSVMGGLLLPTSRRGWAGEVGGVTRHASP